MSETVKKTWNISDLIHRKEIDLHIGVMDVLYSLLCYGLSACEIMNGRTPFALCAYAAAFTKGKWYAFIAVAILGLIRFRMDFDAIVYVFAVIVATFFMGIIKCKREIKSLATALSLFTVLLCRNIISGFSLEIMIFDITESIICYCAALAISNAITLMASGSLRKCVFDTEVLQLFALFSLVVRCFVNVPPIWGLSIANIFALVILLIINLQGDVTFGTTMGLMFGIAVYDTTSDFAASMGAYAFASLCSGLLKRFGKWGVVLGLVIANASMVAFFRFEVFPFDIFEVIGASVIFALLPRKITEYLSSFPAKTVHAATNAFLNQDKMQKVISARLTNLSEAYRSLAISYNRCFENKNLSKEYIIHMLDSASARICPGCGLKYNCWERGYKESYKAMIKMLEIAEENGKINVSDVPEPLNQKCIKLDEFVEMFNRMYEVYKTEKLWQVRLNESRMLVAAQLAGVSKSVRKLAADFDMCLDVAAEKELKIRLDSAGLDFADITFLSGKTEEFVVEIVLKYPHLSPKNEGKILKAIMDVTDKNSVKVSQKYTSEGVAVVFKSATEYTITVGSASGSRYGEKVSGDSFTMCENSYGEFVAAISDGMGTGKKAAEESANATELLKNFMSAGMDVETALELINSALLLRSSGDSFVTMDVCVVNPYDGLVKFYKSGAAPGFIKNECGVSTIDSDSLPFGVLADCGKINTEIYTLNNSAIAVLVSDGISDVFSENNETELKSVIEASDTQNPQVMASMILKSAIELSGGKPHDDMTVVVLGIKKA